MNNENDLITSIYDSATQDTLWPETLDRLTYHSNAQGVIILVVDQNHAGTPYSINAGSRVFRDFLSTPAGKYYMENLRHLENPMVEYILQQKIRSPINDSDAGTPTKELDSREDYISIRENCNIQRRTVFRLHDNPIWSDLLSFGYPPNFDPNNLLNNDQISLLIPHIAKSIEMGRMFAALRARYRAVLAVLDRVGVGLAVTLATGEIIVENAEASRIFSAGDGLIKSRNSHLRCSDPDLTRAAAAAIGRAVRHRPETQAEVLLSVPRPSGALNYLIEITPLSDPENEIDTRLEGALIKIIDPAFLPDFDIRRFSIAYSLSSAETEVAALLYKGIDLGEIADCRNTRPLTVRNQVSSIMVKVGCSSRADLIRQMVRVLPPIK